MCVRVAGIKGKLLNIAVLEENQQNHYSNHWSFHWVAEFEVCFHENSCVMCVYPNIQKLLFINW